jgi:hypothetical protein
VPLRYPDLEGNPRPRRRLLKNHSERPAGEEVMLFAALLQGFQLVGEVEDALQLGAGPVSDAREIPAFQVLEHRNHVRSMLVAWPVALRASWAASTKPEAAIVRRQGWLP